MSDTHQAGYGRESKVFFSATWRVPKNEKDAWWSVLRVAYQIWIVGTIIYGETFETWRFVDNQIA